ncbi:ABC transporter ATP-binding protein [Paenibacillus allorhizosphaerae]|uniref:Multidrug export ATP-binding/permease protein n=1 Tax=Paenibacillus allorhizosphaerae TaxID=2849866 RepID=A0ABN7TLV7_9BACL|nr:ABC transporter ATP-binding protein [Paenibacillus allorhizosphaerae]CAG7646295.1 Putative multidrug export ATP-binding/permease protein [Paenibacillus allorhizosphaerae]
MNTFKWIWGYLYQTRAMILLGVGVLTLQQLVQIMAQGSQKFLIDDVLIGKEYGKLSWVLLYLASTSLVSYGLNWWGNYLTRVNQLTLHRRMGSSLMAVIQRKPVAEIQNQRTAKWVQYFTSDIQQVTDFLSRDLAKGVQQVAATLFLIGIIAWASPVILILVVIFSVVYIGLGRYFGPIMRRQTREMQEKRGDLLVKIEEGIASTREVIAYNRMEWEEKNFRSAFAAFFDKVMQNGKMSNTQLLLSNSTQWIGRLGVLIIGGYEVIQGSATLGMFVVVYQYSNQLFSNFQNVFNFFMNLSGRMAYVDRVKGLFEQEQSPGGTKKLTGAVRSIRFDQVSFAYSEESRSVLNQLSLVLETGRKIAIVGTSGGGKSTIAQLLLRFFEPTQGAIRVNGKRLSEIRMDDWMSRISVVFQEPFLLPDTVRNNLLLGREHISEEQLTEACRIAQIHDFIESLDQGYDTIIGERGYTLSGGQRQRLAIARAIVGDPEILLLDEATSALDMETERLMQEELDRIREGRTTIIIAHRLSTIRNADVILVMDQGRLAEHGTHEELMASGDIYKRLVASMAEAS